MKGLQKTQGGDTPEIVFRCYCGEDSWLTITWDSDFDYIVTITKYPTRLSARLNYALKALCGLEFQVSNEVLLSSQQVADLVSELRLRESIR